MIFVVGCWCFGVSAWLLFGLVALLIVRFVLLDLLACYWFGLFVV